MKNVNIKLSGNHSSTHMIRYHGSTEFYCDQCDLNADTRLLFGSTLRRYILKKVGWRGVIGIGWGKRDHPNTPL